MWLIGRGMPHRTRGTACSKRVFLTNRQREHKALFDDVIVLFPNGRSVNKVGIKRFDSSSNYFVSGPKNIRSCRVSPNHKRIVAYIFIFSKPKWSIKGFRVNFRSECLFIHNSLFLNKYITATSLNYQSIPLRQWFYEI